MRLSLTRQELVQLALLLDKAQMYNSQAEHDMLATLTRKVEELLRIEMSAERQKRLLALAQDITRQARLDLAHYDDCGSLGYAGCQEVIADRIRLAFRKEGCTRMQISTLMVQMLKPKR